MYDYSLYPFTSIQLVKTFLKTDTRETLYFYTHHDLKNTMKKLIYEMNKGDVANFSILLHSNWKLPVWLKFWKEIMFRTKHKDWRVNVTKVQHFKSWNCRGQLRERSPWKDEAKVYTQTQNLKNITVTIFTISGRHRKVSKALRLINLQHSKCLKT